PLRKGWAASRSSALITSCAPISATSPWCQGAARPSAKSRVKGPGARGRWTLLYRGLPRPACHVTHYARGQVAVAEDGAGVCRKRLRRSDAIASTPSHSFHANSQEKSVTVSDCGRAVRSDCEAATGAAGPRSQRWRDT